MVRIKLEDLLQPDQLKKLEEMGIDEIKKQFEERQREHVMCNCKGCHEEREALQMQLDHPFYKRVDKFREEVKADTLAKASKKYDEPFNPQSWSVRQLGWHAMAENYDQSNYIVGLMERAEWLKAKEILANERANALKMENKELYNENIRLKKEIARLKGEEKGAVIDERV